MRAIDQILTTAELEAIRALVRRSRFAEGAASAQGAATQVQGLKNQQLECSREQITSACCRSIVFVGATLTGIVDASPRSHAAARDLGADGEPLQCSA